MKNTIYVISHISNKILDFFCCEVLATYINEKKGVGYYIYGWTRSEYNLLQEEKEKIMKNTIYVIFHISNKILDFSAFNRNPWVHDR